MGEWEGIDCMGHVSVSVCLFREGCWYTCGTFCLCVCVVDVVISIDYALISHPEHWYRLHTIHAYPGRR